MSILRTAECVLLTASNTAEGLGWFRSASICRQMASLWGVTLKPPLRRPSIILLSAAWSIRPDS